MFEANSGLVKLWVEAVKNDKYELVQVPNLSNLKQVVTEIINGTAS